MDSEVSFNITFLKGDELKPADIGGLSDPYCEIISPQVGLVIPNERKTSYKKNTLSPVWNESFDIRRTRPGVNFKFNVWDHDFIGSDDFLGTSEFSLNFLDQMNNSKPVTEFWVKLFYTKEKTGQIETIQKGRILIRIKLNPKFMPGNWIPINLRKVKIGLGWDFITKRDSFDLDSSVSGFDSNLDCKDFAYYHQLEAFNGAIKHHGDDRSGRGEGDDEVITITLDKIPFNINYLAVCVNSYKGNSMAKARCAFIRLFDKNREIGKFVLNRTKDCIGLLFGLFSRRPNTAEWYFRVMADPIGGNKISTSIPDIKALLKGYQLDGNKNTTYTSQKVKHPLPGEQEFVKGNWFPLQNQLIHVGLGWDFQVGQTYDLDSSAILMDQAGNVLDIIFHKNRYSRDTSVHHQGDNKMGFGEGDDEIIDINLAKINPNICGIAIAVNSFKGNSLIGVKNGFIRIFGQNGPIGCHLIGQFLDSVGLLLGLFRKNSQGEWKFQVMIDPIKGFEAPQSVNDILLAIRNYPLAEPRTRRNNFRFKFQSEIVQSGGNI